MAHPSCSLGAPRSPPSHLEAAPEREKEKLLSSLPSPSVTVGFSRRRSGSAPIRAASCPVLPDEKPVLVEGHRWVERRPVRGRD